MRDHEDCMQMAISTLDFPTLNGLHNDAMGLLWLFSACNIKSQRITTDQYLLTNELIWGWKRLEDCAKSPLSLLIMRALDDIPNVCHWLRATANPTSKQVLALLRLDPDDQQAIINSK